MKLLVRVAIAAVVIWLGLEYGRPWLERALGGSGGGSRSSGSVAARCIGAVSGAASRFGEGLPRQLQPPIDLDRWSDAYAAAEDDLRAAREDCRCEQAAESERAACDEALGALGDLESFVAYVDDELRAGQAPVGSARRQQDVDERLASARRLLP